MPEKGEREPPEPSEVRKGISPATDPKPNPPKLPPQEPPQKPEKE
jgi:hypothetical protein